MVLLQLAWEFLKVGLFTVGGGLAAIPFLEDIITRHPEWYTHQQLIDMIAISESTPGPISVNMATYIGFSLEGVLGAIVATLSFCVPAFIIASTVSRFLTRFNESPLVSSAFYGLRPAVCALIANAAISIIKITLFSFENYAISSSIISVINLPAIILFGLILFLVMKFKKHPIVYISAAAVIGIIFKM